MKKIIIGIYLVATLLSASESVLDDVQTFEDNGNYKLAREKLANNINNDNKLVYFRKWIDLDNNKYKSLNDKINIQELTKFKEPEEWSLGEWVAVGAGTVAGGALIFFTAGVATPAVCAVGAACAGGAMAGVALAGGGAIVGGAVTAAAIDLAEKGEEGVDPTFYLIEVDEAKEVLSEYNQLKSSQKLLKAKIDLHAQNELNDLIISFLNEQKILQKQIEESRQNYLSYSVMSPYLATANYHIFLSNKDWFGHDEDELILAADYMGHGAYKNTLNQVNENVRKQWFNTQKNLKETASEKEWKDLKVRQTILDTSSDKKNIGKKSWWNE